MLVFSTNKDLMKLASEADVSEEEQTLSPSQQKLHIQMERKGHGGKTVTMVLGFVGSDDDLQQLAKTLKTKCGVGGSARGGEILIQGDKVQKVKEILTSLGYNVK